MPIPKVLLKQQIKQYNRLRSWKSVVFGENKYIKRLKKFYSQIKRRDLCLDDNGVQVLSPAKLEELLDIIFQDAEFLAKGQFGRELGYCRHIYLRVLLELNFTDVTDKSKADSDIRTLLFTLHYLGLLNKKNFVACGKHVAAVQTLLDMLRGFNVVISQARLDVILRNPQYVRIINAILHGTFLGLKYGVTFVDMFPDIQELLNFVALFFPNNAIANYQLGIINLMQHDYHLAINHFHAVSAKSDLYADSRLQIYSATMNFPFTPERYLFRKNLVAELEGLGIFLGSSCQNTMLSETDNRRVARMLQYTGLFAGYDKTPTAPYHAGAIIPYSQGVKL
jgi:hypothetical protein